MAFQRLPWPRRGLLLASLLVPCAACEREPSDPPAAGPSSLGEASRIQRVVRSVKPTSGAKSGASGPGVPAEAGSAPSAEAPSAEAPSAEAPSDVVAGEITPRHLEAELNRLQAEIDR